MNSLKHKKTNMNHSRRRIINRADLCDNPKLFESTYWSNFGDGDTYLKLPENQAIINNRNWVAKHFKLKYRPKLEPLYAYDFDRMEKEMAIWHDHAEIYACLGGFIVFLSPYLSRDTPIPEGWTRTRPIYDTGCPTIYKFVPGRGAKARMERLGAVAPAIQRQFRKARYDPKYKMCRAVLYRNLEECGALTNGEADNVWQECGIIN